MYVNGSVMLFFKKSIILAAKIDKTVEVVPPISVQTVPVISVQVVPLFVVTS